MSEKRKSRFASTRDDSPEKIWSILQAPEGKYHVTEYDWFDGEFFVMEEFDTLEEAVAFAQKEAKDSAIQEIVNNSQSGSNVTYQGMRYDVRDDTGASVWDEGAYRASVYEKFDERPLDALVKELQKAHQGKFRVFALFVFQFPGHPQEKRPHIFEDFTDLSEARRTVSNINKREGTSEITREWKIYDEEGSEVLEEDESEKNS